MVWESQCLVTCAFGYTGSPVKSCITDGSAFVFSGCTLMPKCTAPASLTGYMFTGCAGSIYASQCNPTCASDYAGTPFPVCSTDGGTFTLSGCEPLCNLPPTVPTGYFSGTCGSQRADTAVAACNIACAHGYSADVITATCPTAGADLVFSGCVPIPICSLLPNSHLGYDVSNCNPGRGPSYGIPPSHCMVTCAAGYTGNAMSSCASSGTFAFSGCARLPTCVLPSSTAGYVTSRCMTSIDCSWMRGVTTTMSSTPTMSTAMGSTPTMSTAPATITRTVTYTVVFRRGVDGAMQSARTAAILWAALLCSWCRQL